MILTATSALCLHHLCVHVYMKGREVKWANPKLGMRNCSNITKNALKSRVYPLSFFGLGEFSLCPETHFKGIFNSNGGKLVLCGLAHFTSQPFIYMYMYNIIYRCWNNINNNYSHTCQISSYA